MCKLRFKYTKKNMHRVLGKFCMVFSNNLFFTELLKFQTYQFIKRNNKLFFLINELRLKEFYNL